MAEPTQVVDPRIYGGEAPSTTPVPTFTPPGTAAGQPDNYTPPERVDQSAITGGEQSQAEGRYSLAVENRPTASINQSAVAAMKSWSPVRVYDFVNMPHFDTDPDFDPKPFINRAPFSLTEDEHKFLATSRSLDEFNYRMDNAKEQRDLHQQIGDHPFVAGVLSIADPGYLALDILSMGAGRLVGAATGSVRAARAASFAASAAGTYALGEIEQSQAPMSDKEVILGALMNGAASAMAYRAGKGLVKLDPNYPSDALTESARKLAGDGMAVEKRIVSEAADVAEHPPVPVKAARKADEAMGTAAERAAKQLDETPNAVSLAYGNPQSQIDATLRSYGVRATDAVTDAHSYLGRHLDDPTFGPMIKTLMDEQPELLRQLKVIEAGKLKNSRAFYMGAAHTMVMPLADSRTGGLAFTALHEAMHGLTVHKIEYGLANMGSAHGRLARELDSIRRDVMKLMKAGGHGLNEMQVSSIKYHTKDLKEFVAGLYSGERGLPTLLARMPAAHAPNMLTKMVDTVRKLLGIPPGQTNALTKAMGLTDELVRTKLKVSNVGGTLVNFAPPAGTPAQMAATIIKQQEGRAASLGQKLSWSLHKTLAGFGDIAKKVADTLVDDPINMTGDSAVSQRQAIRSDLATHQYVYEEALKAEMAVQGAGLRTRILQPAKAAAIQQTIEKKVYAELDRRARAVKNGTQVVDNSVDPAIKKMADAHDVATGAGGAEMKAAGVLGADGFDISPGYATRKWSITAIENVEKKLLANNPTLTEKQVRAGVKKLVADGIARANPSMEAETVRDVASAIIDRARAKGYFEDSSFVGHVGNPAAKQVRDIMTSAGVPPNRIDKAMAVLTGVTDEAGKISTLKRRVDMDITTTITHSDGTTSSIMDLLDTNVTRNLENYLDNAAGNAGLARKGLVSATDIDNLRTEMLRSIGTEAERAKAADLFDNVIASLKGNPVGEQVADGMRKLQAVTQMVGLASSGLWQVTEYANTMAKYGLVKTTREILRTMPVFKQLMGEIGSDAGTATSLNRILSRNASQDIRIRPFVQKMEDNFEMAVGDNTMMALQSAKQLVPYLNAMRYIHHNQSHVVGNLIADVFHKGALGNTSAREALAKYGLEGHTLDSVASDIKTHGLDTEKWSAATWAQIRGPLGKMVDDAVLRNRTGEIPAFAQFNSVGKFIFTFRSFVLGAHNKVLAGTLGREGFAGMGLLMLYQFPLTMMASAVNNTVQGKPQPELTKLASQSVSQMGAMGLLSELWGVASGDKQQFGSSGLIAIDRLYKTGAAASAAVRKSYAGKDGDYGKVAANGFNSLPLLSILPFNRAISATWSDSKKKE